MDVLFGSIDVRDLLSSHEFEDSSPLSAPDLRLLIDRLQVRSLHIKDKVRNYILSHHRDFSEIFSRCSQSLSNTDQISSSVSTLLKILSERPIDLEIRDLVTEICVKRREFEERKEALGLVRLIMNLVQQLESVKADLKSGRLISAAEVVRDLKGVLSIRNRSRAEDDHAGEDKEPAVFGLLREEWNECFDEVQEFLAGIIGNAVVFEPENGRVRVKSRVGVGEIDCIELRTVLMAMDIAGVLDYGLAKVADLMFKYVISPTVCNELDVFVEELNQDSEQKAESILSLVPSPKFQVIRFIYVSICFHNGTWMRCFGRLTWSRISDLVINAFLSKAVPEDAAKVAEFQNIIKLTTEFENAIKEMMFISATEYKDGSLSTFAQNVEVHFATRKKNEILAKARNLLLQCEFAFSPAPVAGEKIPENAAELLFQPERCLVSKAASQLIELVHQTLKDVCLSSTRVSMEFYHAARDALLLYEAIVPVKLEKQFDSINQVAVVVHNDCLYLSQEILGLAFEYRSYFPSGVKEHAMFVDMAPKFCEMAEEILQKQVQLVILNLTEAIDGADGFQNTHQMQQYESAKFSIDQVVFILEKVHIIWEPLLLPSTYRRIMSIVLEAIFSRITRDILLLDDMAAEETLQLQSLIHFTLENLSSLLDSLVVNEKEKLSENYIWIQLDELLPSLRKLRKLADLLDMPLKSITTTWETGELVSCGFTSSEVQNFVKAIFTDSPLRRECLWRIESENSG
ncbi:centromere/kinetochore protein, putative (ZW10) isoform X2 [Tasmannia lanceolata]|uniref:centromere/kinetochore protein, putative (ZW10) isoform X2 n=1 Tax=Tasmannia lanceolata TaxID=3420 RepID=UPI004062D618